MRRGQRTGLLLAAWSMAGATAAQAQPALTPPGAAPLQAPAPPATGAEDEREDGPKSPGTALAWSLGGTAAAVGLVALGGAMTDRTTGDPTPLGAGLSTVGSLTVWVAPSFGHFYADRYWTTGLKVRLGGVLVASAGAIAVFTCVASETDGSGDDQCVLPLLLLGAGAGMVIGGAAHDVATAPRAARRYNARYAARAQGWAAAHLQVAPTLVGSAAGRGPGLVLGGSF